MRSIRENEIKIGLKIITAPIPSKRSCRAEIKSLNSDQQGVLKEIYIQEENRTHIFWYSPDEFIESFMIEEENTRENTPASCHFPPCNGGACAANPDGTIPDKINQIVGKTLGFDVTFRNPNDISTSLVEITLSPTAARLLQEIVGLVDESWPEDQVEFLRNLENQLPSFGDGEIHLGEKT